MLTGIMTTPLHGGKAPAWLFKRMQALAGEIVSIEILETAVEKAGIGEKKKLDAMRRLVCKY